MQVLYRSLRPNGVCISTDFSQLAIIGQYISFLKSKLGMGPDKNGQNQYDMTFVNEVNLNQLQGEYDIW
jgi:hypothetical protein